MLRTQLRTQAEWRHLYRAILRECTYLPDPIANQYMRDYIRLSFRENSSKFASGPIPQPRLNIIRRRAKTYLSVLSRANEGYLKPLERVLFLSYGRIGRRKHLLLQPLLAPDAPGANTNPSSADWKAPSCLLGLAKSQARQEVTNVLQSIASVRPQLSIPEKNIWGRPMPLKRQRNMRMNWYNNLINDVLPPLPHREWKILHSLATGKGSWEPPKRRKSLQPKVQSPYLDAEFLVRGPRKGFTFKQYVKGRPHHLKPRLMKRLWRRLCSLTPRMTWDAKIGEWNFQWGVAQPPPVAYYKPGSTDGLNLFEGVNPKSGKRLV